MIGCEPDTFHHIRLQMGTKGMPSTPADAIPGAAFMVVKRVEHVVPNLNACKDAMIDHMGKVK